jgi:predicted Zn-dependent protease
VTVRLRRISLVLASVLALGACRAGDIGGNLAANLARGAGGGALAADIARAAVVSAADVYEQMSIRFSPEQEYYLGRAVAANLIARHGLDPDQRRQEYVRKVGAAIVALSDNLRGTYGGYHFAVLDDEKPNGASGPGGFVLVTRGAVDLARTEDELAAVLAHELAHVQGKHAESIIRTSRQWQSGLAAAGRLVGAAADGGQFASRMATLFRETAANIVETVSVSGYGRELEYAADLDGSKILYDVGYDGGGVARYLKVLPDRPSTAWSSHGDPDDRARALTPFVAQYGGDFDGGVGRAAREARFRAALGR